MADEPTPNGNENPTPGNEGGNETTVTITQEKLDSLINEKFKKGAEKANAEFLQSLGVESIDAAKEIMKAKQDADEASKTDLEKANGTIDILNTTIESLTSKLSVNETDNKINSLALENGIKEVEYFKYEYNKASKTEGFDEKVFIDNLLKSKGELLTGSTSKNIDNPPNVTNNSNAETITMSAYSLLGSEERQKYKPNQIIKG